MPPAGSGELTPPAAGQKYCSQYVMAAPPADATTAMPLNGSHVQPDARQQAPFEVGDFITYSGTLMQDADGNDFISAHTIEANLGIYTQPGTQPSYVAIGEFGVGTADPAATAVNGAAQETQDRIFLEAETTDFKTPVDIYYEDVNPADGTTVNRWVTPAEMTGEAATAQWPQGGGITTAEHRCRSRSAPGSGATKAPDRPAQPADAHGARGGTVAVRAQRAEPGCQRESELRADHGGQLPQHAAQSANRGPTA